MTSSDRSPRPTEAEASNWTPEQWSRWFRDEVMSSSRWELLEAQWDDRFGTFGGSRPGDDGLYPSQRFASGEGQDSVDVDLVDGVTSLANAMDTFTEAYVGSDPFAGPLKMLFDDESWDRAFARVPIEKRLRFLQGWNRVTGSSGGALDYSIPWVSGEPARPADAAGTEYWVNITLPNGTILRVATGVEPSGGSNPEARAGEPAGSVSTDPHVEPEAAAEVVSPSSVSRSVDGFSRSFDIGSLLRNARLLAVAAVLLVVAVVAIAALAGGGGSSAVPAGSSGGSAVGEATSRPATDAADPLVLVRTKDGQTFLDVQFIGTSRDDGCEEQHAHLRADYIEARSFEQPAVGIPDPGHSEDCGFGTWDSFPRTEQRIPFAQFAQFCSAHRLANPGLGSDHPVQRVCSQHRAGSDPE